MIAKVPCDFGMDFKQSYWSVGVFISYLLESHTKNAWVFYNYSMLTSYALTVLLICFVYITVNLTVSIDTKNGDQYMIDYKYFVH